MAFQCPGGVTVLTPSAHLYTVASWSRVRLLTVLRTSVVSVAIWEDEVDGGGPGRAATKSVGESIQPLTWPKTGSMGGRAGVSWLTQGISPRAIAELARACQMAALPAAAFMPSEPARVVKTAATD